MVIFYFKYSFFGLYILIYNLKYVENLVLNAYIILYESDYIIKLNLLSKITIYYTATKILILYLRKI